MKPGEALIQPYARAVATFRKLDADLAVALDGLKAARTDDAVADITPIRKRAVALERECGEAWEVVERARHAFWRERAAHAERQLTDAAMPLLATIEFCGKAGGALVGHPGVSILSRLGALPRPPYAASDSPVPAEQTACAALDRAEDELF